MLLNSNISESSCLQECLIGFTTCVLDPSVQLCVEDSWRPCFIVRMFVKHTRQFIIQVSKSWGNIRDLKHVGKTLELLSNEMQIPRLVSCPRFYLFKSIADTKLKYKLWGISYSMEILLYVSDIIGSWSQKVLASVQTSISISPVSVFKSSSLWGIWVSARFYLSAISKFYGTFSLKKSTKKGQLLSVIDFKMLSRNLWY